MTSKEIAEKFLPPGNNCVIAHPLTRDDLIADIDAAIAESVKATAERCAAIADESYKDPGYHMYYRAASSHIRELIRREFGLGGA